MSEQITKVKEQPPKKEKDPKRVAAGKKLDEYHRKQKEAVQRLKELEDNNNSFPNGSYLIIGALALTSIVLVVKNYFFNKK